MTWKLLDIGFGQWANLKNTLRFGSRCSTNSPSLEAVRYGNYCGV